MTFDEKCQNNTSSCHLGQTKTIPITPSGYSHTFDVGIATALGINAAIVFNHIAYWIRINAAKGHNFKENKYWMYESIPDIANFFGYLSEKQIKTAIQLLVDNGLLIKGNFNPCNLDRTSWYTFADQTLLGNSKKSYQKTCRDDGGTHGDDVRKDLEGPSSYIDNKNTNKNNTHKEVKPVCVKFGDFVKLKEGEHEKLTQDYGKALVDEIIAQMNDYCAASKPNGYLDYAAAIRQWIRKRKEGVGSKGFGAPAVDRRTKNKDGTPVDSPADGRF